MCRLRRGADGLRQHLGERGSGMLRVRPLPGGAPLSRLPHQERQHGLLGCGRGRQDDVHGKRQGERANNATQHLPACLGPPRLLYMLHTCVDPFSRVRLQLVAADEYSVGWSCGAVMLARKLKLGEGSKAECSPCCARCFHAFRVRA